MSDVDLRRKLNEALADRAAAASTAHELEMLIGQVNIENLGLRELLREAARELLSACAYSLTGCQKAFPSGRDWCWRCGLAAKIEDALVVKP